MTPEPQRVRAELEAARDLIAAIGEYATLPLPVADGWPAYNAAARMRLYQVRMTARSVADAPGISSHRHAAAELRQLAAAELPYTPDKDTMPKIITGPEADGGNVAGEAARA